MPDADKKPEAPQPDPRQPQPPPPPQQPPPPPPGKRRWWLWALVIGLVVVAVTAFLIYRHIKAARAAAHAAEVRRHPPPVPVVTAKARKGDIGVYRMGLGTVTPIATVMINSRVQGEVMRVDYREGQEVHKGDSLVLIDPRPYEAALHQAEGQLERDQALLKESEIDLKRYQSAFDRNAIAKQQLDDQEQVMHQNRGTVIADEGAVQTARVNLSFCHIRSPIDGRVGLRQVDPGNMVQANSTTPLVVVTQLKPITVIFSLSEDFLGEIQEPLRRGQKLEVTALDRTQEKSLARGALLTLDNVIDTSTGTVKLRALFPNEDEALFPNQFVNARILVATHRGVTLVPSAAIQRNAQGAFVYLITPQQTAVMRSVKQGTVDGDSSAVEGVSPGDEIAVNGFDKLREGVPISRRSPGDGEHAAKAPAPAGGAAP